MNRPEPTRREDGLWEWVCPECGRVRTNRDRAWVQVAAGIHTDATHTQLIPATLLDLLAVTP